MRALLVLLGLLVPAVPLEAQFLSVETDRDSAYVGDVVTLRLAVHLAPQETMASYVPALAGELPEGVRLLSADTLVRDANRVFVGKVRVAFYRPGIHEVPQLQVVLRHTPTDRGTPYSFSQPTITVATLAPAGNPPLKDIRDPIDPSGPSPRTVVLAAVLALLGWLGTRRIRRRHASPAAAETPAAVPLDPRAAALAELDAIARDGWPARDPVRAIELAAGVLRDYLGGMLPTAAGALTTRELVALLPASLNGTADVVRRALGDADLVKIARVRPDAATAGSFVDEVRRLLVATGAGA
ncbi:MAG: hypothetical protein ACJ8B6_13435 [Gemmatimonadales bacterium]